MELKLLRSDSFFESTIPTNRAGRLANLKVVSEPVMWHQPGWFLSPLKENAERQRLRAYLGSITRDDGTDEDLRKL